MSFSRSVYCAAKGAWVCLLRGFYKHFAPLGAKTVRSAYCSLSSGTLPHGRVSAYCLPPSVLPLLNYEHIIANRRVNLCFLNFVFGKECALLHIESLREVHWNENTVDLFHLRVFGREHQAVVRNHVRHNVPVCRIDVKIGRVAFRINNSKPAELLLFRQNRIVRHLRNRITGLVEFCEHRRSKLT